METKESSDFVDKPLV